MLWPKLLIAAALCLLAPLIAGQPRASEAPADSGQASSAAVVAMFIAPSVLLP